MNQIPEFVDHAAAKANPDKYITVEVNIAAIIKSWRESLYSFEWLTSEGVIKTLDDLSENEANKRQVVEADLKAGKALEKPVLGIGIQDNIEIGSGRAILLTLADCGMKTIPVHIPKSCESDFKPFLAAI